MHERPPPPDFRYVGLAPRGGSRAHTLAAGGLGLSALGGLFALSGELTTSVGAALALSFVGLAGWVGARRSPPLPHGAREARMAIVPWGVVLEPDTEPRVLRWPAVRRVEVEVEHTIRGGTPAIVASIVTVSTDREAFVGRAPGATGLERLVAGLPCYAEEAARPVGRDLAGLVPFDEAVMEPVADALLARAVELVAASDGASELDLGDGVYRGSLRLDGAPAVLRRLGEVLLRDPSDVADPRPLAAILAGLLGATGLLPTLTRLVSSPHPFVAATAKASALRLGASPTRVGTLDELSAFVFAEDLTLLGEWAQNEA